MEAGVIFYQSKGGGPVTTFAFHAKCIVMNIIMACVTFAFSFGEYKVAVALITGNTLMGAGQWEADIVMIEGGIFVEFAEIVTVVAIETTKFDVTMRRLLGCRWCDQPKNGT